MSALPRSRLRSVLRRHRPPVGAVRRASVLSSEPTMMVSASRTQLSPISRQPGALSAPSQATPDLRSTGLRLRPLMTIGPFELIERLGQGAQGEVWKANHREDAARPELVALKILNPELIRSPKRLAQFRHEAERGTRLSGPSLLRVSAFGQIDRFHYMAMPFIEGTTLQQIIRDRRARLQGQAPANTHRLVLLAEGCYLHDALRIAAGAARALGRIHDGRMVHRDIKPANILLDSRRGLDVYVCDLGLGRDLEFATPQQMRDGAGTPMYMAPERLLKEQADEILCDVYSLGATLFECVTLKRPFEPPDGLPVGCLPVYLASTLPRRPSTLNPTIPAELEAVILKAMARDPSHRYRSAGEFAAAIDRSRRSLHPSDPAPGLPDVTACPSRTEARRPTFGPWRNGHSSARDRSALP